MKLVENKTLKSKPLTNIVSLAEFNLTFRTFPIKALSSKDNEH